MKIYCKNCKHRGSVTFHTCHHPDAKRVKVKEYDGAYEHHYEVEVAWLNMDCFNKNNKCKRFEQKSWWQ